ncbi:MAG: RNA polymerase subunit sigma-24 [Gammaproteobacteria bacterium]|nr:RNA polymerase subunit sigma-24 [Gammaproteobacteria bacterium]
MHRWLILSVLAFCAWAVHAAALEHSDYATGSSLSAEQAESLEARLEGDPQDIRTRTHLIIYYFQAFADEKARHVRNRHVIWLIRNAPEAGVLAHPFGAIDPRLDADDYVTGKDAWLSHIEREPTNVAFLAHATSYLAMSQDAELIIAYLEELQRLEPQNSKWPTHLGHLYLRESAYDSPGATKATQALVHFQRAYELSSFEPEQALLLEALGKSALAAGRQDQARTYGTSLLEYSRDRSAGGQSLHHGNLILGRVALMEDDVEGAKRHLLEAGRTSGSPTLNSFGPNMRLALELLERGERQVVLEYFDLCSKFWPRSKLEEWAALVKAGRIPEFGANLNY